MVEGNSLENCRTRKGIVSSNLTSSARKRIPTVLPPPLAGSRSSGKNYRTERYREFATADGGVSPEATNPFLRFDWIKGMVSSESLPAKGGSPPPSENRE